MLKRLLLLGGVSLSLFAAGELSGRRAPSFSLPDLNLNYHDILDHRGKVVIVDIMRTSCPHCLTVSKTLEKIKQAYGARVAILSIVNPPDNDKMVSKYLVDNKLTTPILFDCGQVTAAYLKVTPKNPTVHIPHVFVIDQQGMIRNDFTFNEQTRGILEGDGLLTEVGKLLGKQAPAPAKSAK